MHPEYTCPSCGYKFDCATYLEGKEKATPDPGDFTCCLNCGAVLRYAIQNVIFATANEINTELEAKQRFLLLSASAAIKRLKPLKDKK